MTVSNPSPFPPLPSVLLCPFPDLASPPPKPARGSGGALCRCTGVFGVENYAPMIALLQKNSRTIRYALRPVLALPIYRYGISQQKSGSTVSTGQEKCWHDMAYNPISSPAHIIARNTAELPTFEQLTVIHSRTSCSNVKKTSKKTTRK